jgi:hypothetical protein
MYKTKKEFRMNWLLYTGFIYVIIFSISCSNAQKNESIIPLINLNKTDTIESGNEIIISKEQPSSQKGEFILHRAEYFLIRTYSQKQQSKTIEKFITKNKNDEFDKYDSYEMIFVKETEDINEKILNANPEILSRSGFDVHKNIQFIYDWEKGKFNGFLEFENGKIINSSKK